MLQPGGVYLSVGDACSGQGKLERQARNDDFFALDGTVRYGKGHCGTVRYGTGRDGAGRYGTGRIIVICCLPKSYSIYDV